MHKHPISITQTEPDCYSDSSWRHFFFIKPIGVLFFFSDPAHSISYWHEWCVEHHILWILNGFWLAQCFHLLSVCSKGIKTISFANFCCYFPLEFKGFTKRSFYIYLYSCSSWYGCSFRASFSVNNCLFCRASLSICSAFHSSCIHSLNLKSFICLNPQSIYRYIISLVTQTFIHIGTILLCIKVTTMAYIWYICDLKFKCSSMTGDPSEAVLMTDSPFPSILVINVQIW